MLYDILVSLSLAPEAMFKLLFKWGRLRRALRPFHPTYADNANTATALSRLIGMYKTLRDMEFDLCDTEKFNASYKEACRICADFDSYGLLTEMKAVDTLRDLYNRLACPPRETKDLFDALSEYRKASYDLQAIIFKNC